MSGRTKKEEPKKIGGWNKRNLMAQAVIVAVAFIAAAIWWIVVEKGMWGK